MVEGLERFFVAGERYVSHIGMISVRTWPQMWMFLCQIQCVNSKSELTDFFLEQFVSVVFGPLLGLVRFDGMFKRGDL